jgi:heme exporter protein B
MLLSLAILVAVVISFGVTSVFLDPREREQLFPALVWLAFVLNAAVSLGRSFEYEVEHRAIDGLLVVGVAPEAIFFAKWLVNSVVLVLAHAVGVLALAVLLNVSLVSVLAPFSIVSGVVIAAYSALATLAAALSTTSRLRGALLPLILLPLVFPLFFCAVELTTQLMQQHLTLGSVADGEIVGLRGGWFQMLLGLGALYLFLGAMLFDGAVRE